MLNKSTILPVLSLSVLSTVFTPATVTTSALVLLSPTSQACSLLDPENTGCDEYFNSGSGKTIDNSPIVSCFLGAGDYDFCPSDSPCGGGTYLSEPATVRITEQQCLSNGGSIAATL